jgi:fatty-acyl-CoA synthase
MIQSNNSLCAHLVPIPVHQMALRSEGQGLSYGQLRDAIAIAARVFRTAGVKAGDRVAMLMLNEPEMLVNLFALNALGAALLPMNSRLACAEWTACLDDAGAELVIFDDAALKGLSHQGRTISLETWRQMNRQEFMHPGLVSPALRQAEFLALANEQSGQTLALLVYTSGTTGRAKGVMHSGAGLVANARASWTAHAMRADDTVISVLPLFHVGGLCIQTLPALLCGATVVLQRR